MTDKSEYIDGIIENIKWLGFNPSEILYTSDYFDFYTIVLKS